MKTINNEKEVIIHNENYPYIAIIDSNGEMSDFWWVKRSNKLEIFFELLLQGHDVSKILWEEQNQ